MIFIRHGESEWNGVFNKGSGVMRFVMMPFRFASALFKVPVSKCVDDMRLHVCVLKWHILHPHT
jgi:hypothetical protein